MVMRTSVPMCGSTPSNGSACNTQANRNALVILRNAAVPILVHLFGTRNLHWTHQPKTQPLRVGFIPDALRQLRVLLLPARIGSHACTASQLFRPVLPRASAHCVRIRFRRLI